MKIKELGYNNPDNLIDVGIVMKKISFKKIIAINLSFVFLYGLIIGTIFIVILYAVSISGAQEVQSSVIGSFYQAVGFGLFVGVFLGTVLAVIMGVSLMPYRSTISFKNRDYFFPD